MGSCGMCATGMLRCGKNRDRDDGVRVARGDDYLRPRRSGPETKAQPTIWRKSCHGGDHFTWCLGRVVDLVGMAWSRVEGVIVARLVRRQGAQGWIMDGLCNGASASGSVLGEGVMDGGAKSRVFRVLLGKAAVGGGLCGVTSGASTVAWPLHGSVC